ncbi:MULTISPECIES: hypothetical protein [Citrobacter]|uniref:hypothetical protein n=1 Tax=Citrobacter TaxID=544 RepID=UPI001BCB0AC6|nr:MULTISPECIES: hypothetical protein [Citrobacter]MDM3162859.1 hypothetical protein [Citrobacter sp. Cf118]MDT7421744.1 hypothetical protein [Citrobacter freundii]MEB1072876.1 hypothetical protein [Citrobacter freundii]MEB7949050.1 hypothetical protein [Citrobacter freundii]WFY94441.1 hypothetical protein NFK47_10385 [Citrobacter freundii]
MAISHSEILHLAKSMAQDAENEVNLRASIGRAYYSMFHAAHDIAGGRVPKNHPIPGKVFKGGTHARLSQYLADCAEQLHPTHVRTLQLLSVKLKMCHKSRCEADYELTQNIHKSQLDCILKEAEMTQDILAKIKVLVT